jgi:hypothetical protein
VSCCRRRRRRRRFVCKTFVEKKGRRCVVSEQARLRFCIISLSLSHLFPAMFLHPTMEEEESRNTQPSQPTKNKTQKPKKKLHKKKNHTKNKSQTDPFSASSGSIQFQEIFPKRCSNVT